MNGLFFFCGYQAVSCPAAYCTALLELCRERQLTYVHFSVAETGEITFTVSLFTARRLKRLCAACGIPLQCHARGGLPWVLYRYRMRMGLWLGTLATLALMVLSVRFVWDIRISGNETMTRSEVLAELEACGFGIGSYIPKLETTSLEILVPMQSDRISWMALHMDGTVAKVQIIENAAPPIEDSKLPANLIAATDGQIERLEVLRGNCLVKVGQAVKKGELLVSGIYDSNTVGYRYTRAAGSVFARTEEVFEIQIPLCREKKAYAEQKCTEIDLNFFGFSLKIFKSTGNLPIECDIIKSDRKLEIFGFSNLPVGWTVTYARPYQTVMRTYTSEEALELAYTELEEQLKLLSSEAQLLRKEIQTVLEADTLTLTCTVTCVRDIAVQTEFEIIE